MVATPTTNLSYQNFFQATLTGDITASSTDIPLDVVPNGTEGFLVIEPDSTSNREIIYYNSKTSIKVVCPSVGDGRGQDDTTAVAHATGATVIMASVAAYYETLKALFTTTPQGWTPVGVDVSTVTNNGNRSYDIVMDSDVSATLSPGMRLKTTRTVAAPTKCTDLETSSSQYFSKASPAGMTFTDDFTMMAWVKLESYGATRGILARRNGTTAGFSFEIQAEGRLSASSMRIASNNRNIISYQSIPLGKWVHVAATMDNSANTHTMYINGVSVPFETATVGTITAIVQPSTDYVVGAYQSAGTGPMDGKIAQAAVFSSILSASTIRSYMTQGLIGNESSLISAHSFNNSVTDLNTGNANDLTPSGSAVATDADSPFGEQADGTISSTIDYGLVMKVAGTTVTVQVPEGCTIPTSGGVTTLEYSTQDVPFGFPKEESRWAIVSLSADNSSSLGTTAWANSGSIMLTVPVGSWRLNGQITGSFTRAGGTGVAGATALSEATTSLTPGYEESVNVVQTAANLPTFVAGATSNCKTNKTYAAATTIYGVTNSQSVGTLLTYNGSLHQIKAIPEGL
jgi:hypothetical protein